MQAAVYPWREGNQYRLMIDGECFFPRLLEAIEQARESIEIELYLIDSGLSTRQWIDALLAARERGVRVYCLLDGVGTDGFKTA